MCIRDRFGTDEILKNVSFHIEANEKAAIVGINGAGKSTLLKIIMQKETPDTGEVILAKDATIGYLAQYQDVSGHRTIYEEVLDVKKNIIEMEERLRGMEAQMNALTGQELEALLDGYHRLSHEFELLGGYTSVSYTHLDVYKRQNRSRCTRILCGRICTFRRIQARQYSVLHHLLRLSLIHISC